MAATALAARPMPITRPSPDRRARACLGDISGRSRVEEPGALTPMRLSLRSFTELILPVCFGDTTKRYAGIAVMNAAKASSAWFPAARLTQWSK